MLNNNSGQYSDSFELIVNVDRFDGYYDDIVVNNRFRSVTADRKKKHSNGLDNATNGFQLSYHDRRRHEILSKTL